MCFENDVGICSDPFFLGAEYPSPKNDLFNLW